MTTNARGLTMFISDIRNCSTVEKEKKRVDKELANIRNKFTREKGLDSYNKKKYVWKLVYIYMLGYDVEFGHMQVINLVSSSKYTEKHVGYIATAVLMRNTDELMTLIVNSVRSDLKSGNDASQSLALCAVANLGGKELTDTLAPDVLRVLTQSQTRAIVRKKAALCMLRLYRVDPDTIVHEEFVEKAVSILTKIDDIGVLTSTFGLINHMIKVHAHAYTPIVKPCILILSRLVVAKACRPDYLYYNTCCPWLQVKILQALQHFDPPEAGSKLEAKLNESLYKIMHHTDVTKSVNKNNADHSILFEAVNLLTHYAEASSPKMRAQAMTLLGRFIGVREPNIRYLGLSTMSKFVSMCRLEGINDVTEHVKKHKTTILKSLKDTDVSIRKRSLDLVFAMCDRENAVEIVKELLAFLPDAELSLKEEMVLKIAILAERYATDYRWYLDTILQIITLAGDYVSDDIWHRVVIIVTNREELQLYSADVMFQALQNVHVHETTVKAGAYILGEFGYLLTDPPEDEVDAVEQELVSSQNLFDTLRKHLTMVSDEVKQILLHAFIKFANLYPELADNVSELLDTYRSAFNVEVQQRACEYFALPSAAGEEKMQYVLDPMPPFPDDRESALEKRLKEKEKGDEEVEERVETDSDLGGQDIADDVGQDGESDGGDVESQPDASHDVAGDLLGLTMSEGSNGAAEEASDDDESDDGEVIGIDESIVPKMRRWFAQCLSSPKSLLYEDNLLQIGVQHQYKGQQGRIMLFVGNKAQHPLDNFSMKVPENTSGVAVQSIGSTVSMIETKNQLKQQFAVNMTSPFASPPELVVSFRVKRRNYSYGLRLPVTMINYSSPCAMPAGAFTKHWASLTGNGRDMKAVFKIPEVASGSWPTKMAGMTTALKALRFAVIGDIAGETEHSISAATTCKLGGKNLGCLIRVEMNPSANACRLNVRSVHSSFTASTKNVVQQAVLVTLGTLL